MVTDRNKYIWHIDCFLAFHNDRIFSYLHFSFGLIHPFHTEQLHLDLIEPQLPCSPCMTVALFFHCLHRKKALSCYALTAILSFAFQFQHKVESPRRLSTTMDLQPMLPLEDSPGKAGSSVELGQMASPCWELPRPYQSPLALSTFTPSLRLPKLWQHLLSLILLLSGSRSWQLRVRLRIGKLKSQPRRRILRCFPLIMVFSE